MSLKLQFIAILDFIKLATTKFANHLLLPSKEIELCKS